MLDEPIALGKESLHLGHLIKISGLATEGEFQLSFVQNAISGSSKPFEGICKSIRPVLPFRKRVAKRPNGESGPKIIEGSHRDQLLKTLVILADSDFAQLVRKTNLKTDGEISQGHPFVPTKQVSPSVK